MAGEIVLAGSLAQRPGHGGHAWVFLQYLLGLRRLGYDVLFVDELDPEMCVDRAGRTCRFADSFNVRFFVETMSAFGLHGAFSLVDRGSGQAIGVSRPVAKERVARAEALINVMGYLRDDELLAAAQRRVFLDIDPGFGQMWQALGLCTLFQGHDHYATIGANLGRPDCPVPTCGIDWITTPPPIDLESWPLQQTRPPARLTSVASWRGPFDPVQYDGRTYGLRVHEFRKFLELPAEAGPSFELALDIHADETADLNRLAENGWRLVDPRQVAGDATSYRRYVQNSWAEFLVAKEMYVQSHCGWVSDRSVCYLASGRPVIAQDTGLADHYPVDAGFLLFRTPAEALARIDDVARDYARHARAARDLAVEYFDSARVLRRLLSKLGIG